MAQCKKCGRTDRVVSETSGYWGSAFKWTIGSSIFSFFVFRDERLSGNYLAYGVCALLLFTSLVKWIKAIGGASYVKHECKACGNKWTSD